MHTNGFRRNRFAHTTPFTFDLEVSLHTITIFFQSLKVWTPLLPNEPMRDTGAIKILLFPEFLNWRFERRFRNKTLSIVLARCLTRSHAATPSCEKTPLFDNRALKVKEGHVSQNLRRYHPPALKEKSRKGRGERGRERERERQRQRERERDRDKKQTEKEKRTPKLI